jgi:hypothetical protein
MGSGIGINTARAADIAEIYTDSCVPESIQKIACLGATLE